jgi:ferritin-like metal-binding protein YciE
MATPKTLEDAFYEGLKDIYFAERTSVRALKKAARAAQEPRLKEALERHEEESAQQVERLQQVFEIFGKAARGKTCEAIQGLLAELEEQIEDFKGSEAADAVLISGAQAMEHYEIARYGTLRSWAAQLGLNDAVKLLEETLAEEEKTDELLTQMAEEFANQAAA